MFPSSLTLKCTLASTFSSSDSPFFSTFYINAPLSFTLFSISLKCLAKSSTFDSSFKVILFICYCLISSAFILYASSNSSNRLSICSIFFPCYSTLCSSSFICFSCLSEYSSLIFIHFFSHFAISLFCSTKSYSCELS